MDNPAGQPSLRGMNRRDAQEGSSQEVGKQKALDVFRAQLRDLDKGDNGLQHTKVEISKTARFKDRAKRKFGLEVSKHTPERVNEQVDRFKDTLKKIRNKCDYLDCFPEDLKPLFVKMTRSLYARFQAALENAVDSYDSNNPLSRFSKHKERHNAQDSLEKLNAQLDDMVKVLDGWRYMTTVSERASSATGASHLDITPTGTESLGAMNDQLDKAKGECKKALGNYQGGTDEWKPFRDIVDWFKKPMERGEDQVTERDRKEYLEEFFKRQFMFHLIERGFAPEKLLSSINYKTEIMYIRREYEIDVIMSFAIARGKTIEEKSKITPCKDTTKDFTSRYDIISEGTCDNIRVKKRETDIYTYRLNRDEETLEIPCTNEANDPKEEIGGIDRFPFSEATYNLLLTKDFFKFKRIIRKNVVNEITTAISDIMHLDRYSHKNNFKYGTDEYYAMLGTRNVTGIVFLLEQHKDKFGNKKITEIQWIEDDLILTIGNKE